MENIEIKWNRYEKQKLCNIKVCKTEESYHLRPNFCMANTQYTYMQLK